MHVMAGILRDTAGRVLLAQRPPGKHLAGLWEFPGGKIEPGESPWHALVRELREELGIDVEDGKPLIRIPWRYERGELCLDAWLVERWDGEPASLEGQALQWALPDAVDLSMLAPADRPILQALRLPSVYAITPADTQQTDWHVLRERVAGAIEQGVRLIQLRLPLWSREAVRELAAALLSSARSRGAWLVLNEDIEGARQLGDGVGVQLKSAQLSACAERPLPLHQLVGASCHDAAELALAAAISADFATLSPVVPTASHPGTLPLGWERFEALAEAASLPVFALGGLSLADLDQARRCGAQGVAGIRGFWSGAGRD
jgi:8-oxo-dGTP diphosphatase